MHYSQDLNKLGNMKIINLKLLGLWKRKCFKMGSFEDEDLNKEGYLGDISIPEKGFGGVFRYTETWGGGG